MDAALARGRGRRLRHQPQSDGRVRHRAGRGGDRHRVPPQGRRRRTRRSRRWRSPAIEPAAPTCSSRSNPARTHGRTPPCVDALIAAAPRRVVVAMIDPNPQVAGARHRGAAQPPGSPSRSACAKPRRGGSTSSTSSTSPPDCPLSPRSSPRRSTAGSRPPAANRAGSPPRRRARLAHRLRHTHDAVLVGINTVLADDPALTTRFEGGRSPLRVVVDSTLRIPDDGSRPPGRSRTRRSSRPPPGPTPSAWRDSATAGSRSRSSMPAPAGVDLAGADGAARIARRDQRPHRRRAPPCSGRAFDARHRRQGRRHAGAEDHRRRRRARRGRRRRRPEPRGVAAATRRHRRDAPVPISW